MTGRLGIGDSDRVTRLELTMMTDERAPAEYPHETGEPAESVGYAVLGGGPAGLTGAYALGLRHHRATVFEADGDVGGIAVHIAARVGALAAPREVLVTSTVKDLVAGSGIQFEDRGAKQLKGIPDEWRLFAAAP